MTDDDTAGAGPQIVAGLQESRAAHAAGRLDEAHAIVDRLIEQYGASQVYAVLGAARFGFISLDDQDD